jgi:hypothetical protein
MFAPILEFALTDKVAQGNFAYEGRKSLVFFMIPGYKIIATFCNLKFHFL